MVLFIISSEHSLEQFGNIEDYLPNPEYEELKNGPPPSSGPGPSGPPEHSGVFSLSFHNFILFEKTN